MKIVIISIHESYPPRFGAAVVTYNIFKYLKGEKYLIQFGSRNMIEKKDGGKIISIKLRVNSRRERFIKIFFKMEKMIKEIKKINPNIIIFEGASWSLYFLYLFKRLKNKKIIYHDHNIEYELRKNKENLLINKITFFSEKYLLKHSYASFLVSKRDANLAKKLYKEIPKPKILENGVDISKFKKIKRRDINKIKKKYSLDGKNLLFLGLPSYPPNKEAIKILREKIMPYIIRKHPNAKLIITGGKIDKKEKFIKNLGNIPFEDLPPLISSCSVGLAPIISGSGTRLKILEYMAAGIPVVSTSKGCEGLEVENGKNIIVNDDFDEFSKSVCKLLSNRKLSRKIGEEGKRLVYSRYSYEKIVKNFQNGLYKLYKKN